MMIELKCPRCETMLRVPESKAGRHGRCPVCGGTITVPVPPVEIPEAPPPVAPQKPPGSKVIWVVLVVIILLSAICVAIALRRGGTLGTAEEGNGPTLTAAQQTRLDAQLIEIGKLEEIVREYRESRVRERHLRAREVLMKINSYAPVTDFEYALRRGVLDEEERTTQSAGNTGENDPWQLNAPLGPSEKDELGLLSDDLQSQSTKLEVELNALGVFVAPVRDPMGRVLLDGAEVSANLVARRESIKRDADKTPP